MYVKMRTLIEALLNRANSVLLRRLWRVYLAEYKHFLLMSVIFMAISALSTALLAHFVRDVFDDIFMAKDRGRLFSLAGLILCVFLVKGFTAYGHNFILAKFGQKVSAKLKIGLFKRLMGADFSLFSAYPSGKLLSFITYDTEIVLRSLTQTLVSFVRDALTLLFLVSLMFYQDWFLSCIACFGFPLTMGVVFFLGKRMRYFAKQTQQAMGGLHAFFGEMFQSIGLIKAYTMETLEVKRAQEKVDEFVYYSLKSAKMKSFLHPLMEAVGGSAVVVVIIYGGMQVISGDRTPGALMSFITALLMSYEPLKKIANLNSYFQEALSALDRIFKLYDVKKTVKEPRVPKPLFFNRKPLVQFEQVSFCYEKGVKVLDDISCVIHDEKRVAFVGENGAGKSTLFHLILRFYDVSQGVLKIGGQDIREVSLKELRSKIAFVSQETFVLADTIANNIRYGRSNASDDEVRKAAQHAFAHGFIDKLPEGYNTFVGERGAYLSGGQRQRIAIARAFLKKAPLLLLDEATSSLDAESEYAVGQGLENLMQKSTTFIIAHRLPTVERADMIYVLSQGRLVQKGCHHELVKQKGVYRQKIVPHFEGGTLRQVP